MDRVRDRDRLLSTKTYHISYGGP